ncbi:MAG: phosphate ABC transporter permease PstA, partial [Thermoplasmata archaeon]
LKTPLATLVDLSAAIPSVVYGFWGFIVVVPIMRTVVEPALAQITGGTGPFSGPPRGLDVLTASIVLAMMIVPTISALSRAAMQAVPRAQREAALSLGATRSETTRLAVLSSARVSILGAVLLGLGRALGETMAVTMTIGNSYTVATSLFSPGQTIASEIANELTSAAPLETSALVELGLILLGITIGVNIIARFLFWRVRPASDHPRRRHRDRALAVPRGLPTSNDVSLASAAAPEWRLRAAARAPRRRRWRRALHRAVLGLTGVCVVLAVAPFVGILWTAVHRGGAAVIRPSFYTSTLPVPCNPASGTTCSLGGIGPAIQGTLILVALASLIAVPIGLLIGVYLSEYGRNRFGQAVSFMNDVMTGFPSILIGLFVFVLFIEAYRNITFSAISGALALAILMLPIVTRATEDALRQVPQSLREAGLAIGFPRHRVTLRVVLGTARNGLITGILLAVARAGGETAALLFTAFGSNFYFQRLTQPIGALPPLIYNLGLTSYPNWQEDAWGATLVLLMIMLAINLTARLAVRQRPGLGEGG